jgi:hypothetical protein
MSAHDTLFPEDYRRETDGEPGLRVVAIPSRSQFSIVRAYVNRADVTVAKAVEVLDDERDARRILAVLNRAIELEVA